MRAGTFGKRDWIETVGDVTAPGARETLAPASSQPLAAAGTSYSLSPSGKSFDEDEGTVTFKITRSGNLAAETVWVSTLHGSSNGYATNNDDYTGRLNYAVKFKEGEKTVTFTVSIKNDSVKESDETFGLIVQASSNDPASKYLAKTTFTIKDDDAAVVTPTTYKLSLSANPVGENAGNLTVTVTRSGTDLKAETIYASTLNGSSGGYATNSGDYTGREDYAVSFASGAKTATFTIPILNDTIKESDETFGIIIQRSKTDSTSTYLDKTSFTIKDDDAGDANAFNVLASASVKAAVAGSVSGQEVANIALANVGRLWGDRDCTDFVWAVTNLAGARFFDLRDRTINGDPLRPKSDDYIVPHTKAYAGSSHPGPNEPGDSWALVAIPTAFGATLSKAELISILKIGDVVRGYNGSEAVGHSFIVTGTVKNAAGTITDILVTDNVDGIRGNPSANKITEHTIDWIIDYVTNSATTFISRYSAAGGMPVETDKLSNQFPEVIAADPIVDPMFHGNGPRHEMAETHRHLIDMDALATATSSDSDWYLAP